MLQSQLLAKTKKKVTRDIRNEGYKFLIKGDFIEQLASGIYNFLPLGYRVHKKIEEIIREEMDSIGAQEVLLAALQPKELWEKTGRWNKMSPPLFKLRDLHKKYFALGSTHEEVITMLAKERIQSYKDLPRALYQIQTKFRNEVRSTGGLLRTREFVMKDLYSFHQTQEDLDNYFDKVSQSYQKIFKRCDVDFIRSEASGGTISSKEERTLEFQIKAENGEDKILLCVGCGWAVNLEMVRGKIRAKCPKCKTGSLKKISTIEIGHIFSLGNKYSKALELYFIDKDGKKKPVIMGCYGIGLGRLMGAIAEVRRDLKGIIWPKEIAPFQVHLIQLQESPEVKKKSREIYDTLLKTGTEVLYDDRDGKSPGEKFADADLIGIPWRIVVSERTLERDSVEVKRREKEKAELVKINELLSFLEKYVQ